MLRKFLFLFFVFILIENVKAEESKNEQDNSEQTKETSNDDKNNVFLLNIKRIGLYLVSTTVTNSQEYQNSSITALSSDSETKIKGIVDTVLEYRKDNYQWDNSLYMIYGESRTKSLNSPTTTNTTDDQILITTDYAYGIWKYNDAKVGPFGNLGYDTQFTKDQSSPRRKIVRGKTGIKLFEGQYFSNLYAAAVSEHDFTYSKSIEKFAVEVGANYKYKLRDGVNFEAEGYYRKYIHFSQYAPDDLVYDLNVTGRMNVRIVKNYRIAPFVSYRLAKSRAAEKYGSNLTVGLSFAFASKYDLR